MAGAVGMEALLRLDPRPTAVFAYSDEIAVAALRCLQEAGVAVPEQMSVIGVDDHPLAELFGLTTVNQFVREQGRLAGQMTLDLLHGRPLDDDEVLVPTHLVCRGSTGPPPN